MTDSNLERDADEMRGDGDDYGQMLSLFSQISQRIKAINADPQAFTSPTGGHDPKMLTAFNSLMSTAAKIISSLHSMRNTDRFLSTVLEDHTKKFAGAVAPALLDELTAVDASLDSIETALRSPEADVSHILTRIVTLRQQIDMFRGQRFLRIFMDAATNTARATASQLGLH